MKSKNLLKLVLLSLLIIWVNIQFGLRVIINENSFISQAQGFLKDLELAKQSYDRHVLQFIVHGVFLSLLSIVFYLSINRLSHRKKWIIIAISIIPLAIISGTIASYIDREIFYLYFLGFNQGSIELNELSLFQHLIIRNSVQVFCLLGTVLAIQVIGDFLIVKTNIISAIRSTTKSYWLITFLIYFLMLYGYFGYTTGGFTNFLSSFTPASFLLSFTPFAIISLIITLFSAIIYVSIYSNSNQKATLSYELLKSLLLIIGASTSFFVISSNLFLNFPFGPKFIDICYSFFQVLVAVILIVFSITYITYRLNIGRIKITLALQNQNRILDSELSLLKSQINPHFLFNSLNTVYGLALEEQSPKSAEGIQKLSDMMRFMLQENTAERIPLEREIKYINDYVDFQTLRIEDIENIQLDIDLGVNCQGEIAPMLLIPMIENAFKHGISLDKPSWITMKLECNQNEVHLNIQNSMHQKVGGNSEESGIGLENVRQRLKILYPNKHLFQLLENDKQFEANIKITLV